MRSLFPMLVLAALCAACAPQAISLSTEPAASEPSATAEPSATPSPAPTATATFTPGWEIVHEAMPDPRGEMPAVILGDQFYVPGGMTRLSPVGGAWAMQGTGTLAVFDPATNSWSRKASLPDAYEGLNHAGVSTYEGRLYTFGGLGPLNSLSKLTLIYDPITDTWSEGAPLPLGRVAPTAVTLGDYLYVLGGYSTIDQRNLRYDPRADSWDYIPAQPTPREHVAAVTFQDEIWLIGGRWDIVQDQILNYTTVEIYNPQTNTWRIGPALNDPRAGFGAVVMDGKIYVVGGEFMTTPANADSVGSVEVYDPAVGKWQIITQMPIAMHGVGVVGHNGKIYVLSGSDRGGVLKPVRFVLIYAP